MKKIAIDLNDVIRDFYDRFHSIYCSYNMINPDDFEKPILLQDTNLLEYYDRFNTKIDLFKFLFDEASLEIFGHGDLIEKTIVGALKTFHIEMVDEEYDLYITSREYGNSVGATYYFLGRNNIPINKVIFEKNYDELWQHFDVIITANTTVLNTKPNDKISVKINKSYNVDVKADYDFDSLNKCISSSEHFISLIENKE
jgi:hypothetical protein